MRNILQLIVLLIVFQVSSAQNTAPSDSDAIDISNMEDSLKVYAHGILYEELAENRFISCERFIKTLVRTLKTPNSFLYPFVEFENISIKYAPDQSFRIFTWQLEVGKGEYRYYGAIQMNTSELKLFPLIDRSFKIKDPSQAEVFHNHWFGSVYYNLISVGTDNPYYLLFGYDSDNFSSRKKVIEVLHFKEGKPYFGKPIFRKGDQLLSRFILNFASEASVRLNYDKELDMIVYDHMVPHPTIPGKMIPDGTYEGFKLINGEWNHVEKVFNTVSDTPIRPAPLTKQRTSALDPNKKS